jgi:hypothetical protein
MALASDSDLRGLSRYANMVRATRFFRVPRKPDFVIGGTDNPYLRRWWLPPGTVSSISTCTISCAATMTAPSTITRGATSLCLLSGEYFEVLPPHGFKLRRPFRPIFRLPSAAHRIQLTHRHRSRDGAGARTARLDAVHNRPTRPGMGISLPERMAALESVHGARRFTDRRPWLR